jgi:predicted metalloprotease with PDZ domain
MIRLGSKSKEGPCAPIEGRGAPAVQPPHATGGGAAGRVALGGPARSFVASLGVAIVGLSTLVAGCAGVPRARPLAGSAAREARHVTTAPRHVDLSVVVRPILDRVEGGVEAPQVEFEVRAESDDLPRRFVLQKRWAGQEEVLEGLGEPRLVCDGADLDVESEDLETHVGWAAATRCRTATIRYAVKPARRGLEWGWEFDVVTSPTLITAIAETALILPDVPDETAARIEVRFDLSRLPSGGAGWEGVYSLGPGHHETTTRALRHAYFAVGRFEKIHHDAGNLRLEARFPEGSPDLAEASRDLLRLLQAEARIFADDVPETLRLLVVGMPSGGGAHGTSLTGSAILWRDRAVRWSSDDARLAAHEMFHLYNGQIIERSAGSGTDAETYWFSEGFTEHYTDELMRRAGVWSAADWLDSVRDRVRRYHRHPDCETPNDKADMRWGGAAVQLPYLRGGVVAAYLDRALRDGRPSAETFVKAKATTSVFPSRLGPSRLGDDLTGNAARGLGASAFARRGLDDFMRALLARARAREAPVDPTEMLRLITAAAGDEVGATVRAVALRGRRMVLPPDTFGSCVEVVGTGAEQDVRIRPGIDLEACMRAGG